MRPAWPQDEAPSEDSKKKAQAAKSYIENMYKVQYQNHQQRTDRCAVVRALLQKSTGQKACS